MTVKDVASQAAVTEGTVRGWIRSGRLPARLRPIGKRNHHVVRINREDYDRFVKTK